MVVQSTAKAPPAGSGTGKQPLIAFIPNRAEKVFTAMDTIREAGQAVWQRALPLGLSAGAEAISCLGDESPSGDTFDFLAGCWGVVKFTGSTMAELITSFCLT